MTDILTALVATTLAAANAARTAIIIENAGSTDLLITEPVTRRVKPGKMTTVKGPKAADEFVGNWRAAALGDVLQGSAVVTEHPADSEDDEQLTRIAELIEQGNAQRDNAQTYTPIKFHAFRANLRQGESKWAMFRKGAANERARIFNVVTRIDKGNRIDTEGRCSLAVVQAINEEIASLFFFSGDSFNDGKEQSITITDTAIYDIEIVGGELAHISSTGEVDSSTVPLSEMVLDPDGGSQLIEVGDTLIFFANSRVDGDQMSISANSMSWAV